LPSSCLAGSRLTSVAAGLAFHTVCKKYETAKIPDDIRNNPNYRITILKPAGLLLPYGILRCIRSSTAKRLAVRRAIPAVDPAAHQALAVTPRSR
jgi:hypothetical protein